MCLTQVSAPLTLSHLLCTFNCVCMICSTNFTFMRLIYRITTFCRWCDDNESKLSVSITDRIETLAGCLCRFFLCKWLIICCWRPINDKWHENNYRIVATTTTSLMPARLIESSILVKYKSFYSCVAVWCKQITSIYYFGYFQTIKSNRFILLHQLDMAVMQRHKNLKKKKTNAFIKNQIETLLCMKRHRS